MSQVVKENIEALCNRLEEFITTKTVVGEAIHLDGVTLVPLVDVSFGLGVGGSEEDQKKAASGAGGMGAKITPSAVLVIIGSTVQLIHIKNQDAVSKLIDMAPGIVDKLGFDHWFGNKKEEKTDPDVSFEETIVTDLPKEGR